MFKIGLPCFLVFVVKTINNPLSYSFTTFATNGGTAFQIMSIFCKDFYYLQKTNLKVIADIADAASPRRKFFRMHSLPDGNARTLL